MDLVKHLETKNHSLYSCLHDIRKFCIDSWKDRLIQQHTDINNVRNSLGLTQFRKVAKEAFDSVPEDLKPFVDLGKLTADTTVHRETAKVGRNDPCPCGSGKKYKKCHGK